MDSEQAQRQAASVLFTRLMGADQHMVRASQLRNSDIREAALTHWHKHPGVRSGGDLTRGERAQTIAIIVHSKL